VQRFDLDRPGNHSGHLLQSRLCHFSGLKAGEGFSVQSVSLQPSLPCITAVDINRPPVPITPSMNCQ